MFATTLEKNVSKFVRKFGVNRARYSETFQYRERKDGYNYIDFSFRHYNEDNLLIDHIKEKFGVDVEPMFWIFSLLHEVGHHMTFPKFEEDDFMEYGLMRQIVLPFMPPDEANKFYFGLPIEDAATRWAIQYIADHFEECWEFQCKVANLFEHTKKKKSFKL